MKYEYRGRNLEITEQLKTLCGKKLDRLSKFFTEDTTVYVMFRAENNTVAAEITIPVKGAVPIRAEAHDPDKLAALDDAMDKLERQIVRYRKKLTSKSKTDPHLQKAYFAAVAADVAEEVSSDPIRRIKTISAKPMDPAEACIQMDLLGHDFFAFRNANSGRVNIVYKRREAGTYGLLDIEE